MPSRLLSADWSFWSCCSIAAATSSALAIVSFVIPQNANALPTADVSQFSRADV